jgi:peptidoglycan/LPS O-acetylase OafA/YrhL
LWQDLVGNNTLGLYHYYKYIYYSTFCRFDQLVAGVGLALLKNHHPDAWRRLTSHGNLMLVAGGAVTALAFWLFLDDRYGFGITVFGYPLLALGFAMLIVAALSPDAVLRNTRVPGAASLALWSYAIYLTHKQVCILAGEYLRGLGYSPQAPAAIGLLLALSVLSGWLLYKLVETPFMALRERYVPTNFARPPVLTPVPR